jgi:hypothetical protein
MTETAPQRILLSVLTAARHSFRAGQDGRRRRVSQHDERGHCGGETKPVVRADALFAGLTARNVCRNAWREPGLCKGRGARASSRTSPRGSSRTSSSSPAEAPPSPRSAFAHRRGNGRRRCAARRRRLHRELARTREPDARRPRALRTARDPHAETDRAHRASRPRRPRGRRHALPVLAERERRAKRFPAAVRRFGRVE